MPTSIQSPLAHQRRQLLSWGLASAVSTLAGAAQAGDVPYITDLAGRSLRRPERTQRILLGEARLIPALSIVLREDLGQRLVGMPVDFEQLDPAGYAQYLRRYPQLRDVARTGRTTGDSFSVEKAIALKPDVAIFGLEGHGPSVHDRETLARLSAAGITVVFIDLRREPLLNTPTSMLLLGQLLQQQAVANAFVRDYRAAMEVVSRRLQQARPDKPTVFIENRVGLSEECCATMSDGLMGRFIDAAGGRNVAVGLVPGAFGTMSLEQLISHPPQIYIGTAIGARETVERMPKRIVLGAGVDEATAQASLKRALQRPGIGSLPAVRNGHAHAVWHHFYNSPFNVAAVQAFAKWFHPRLFADLDPHKTLATLYTRYQAVPLDGVYWTSLPAGASA
ncbi:ABC transporter substrate-binding protein [Curvibacter sp. CHRR-16]|uniref:ABC transporter substrate-binding protein n=1 Tax=Curvibacter sp. CHRR-16 TaxID=2835872 RepID=UPI001BD94748|nr:ABC transporter substrate-binding protein [Curvibacter sp. CHRR-16]MBT0570229.1 ABC transporter substrate-binding protein [Curvibacter sp. CHRR-16]